MFGMNRLSIVFLTLFVVCKNANGRYEHEDDDNYHAGGHDENGHFRPSPSYDSLECPKPSLFGVDWILSRRGEDYGWGEQTHRAIIALAVNNFTRSGGIDPIPDEERQLMEYQLEVELTKALFRDTTTQDGMSSSDLSLYIHALLATARDPRNFHGVDLVEELMKRIRNQNSHPHPFLVLALCNSHSLTDHYVHSVVHQLTQIPLNGQNKDLKAILLKTVACAVDEKFTQYEDNVNSSATELAKLQKDDGSFGNVYTTALVVQALVASKAEVSWDHARAEEFLRSTKAPNRDLISAYLIEMALNAEKVPFLKNLAPVSEPIYENGYPSISELHRRPREVYVQYSIKVGDLPDVYHSITMKIPRNITFFDVMRLAANEDNKFDFSYQMNDRDEPIVYAISGIPNDVEEGLNWRLLREFKVNHTSRVAHQTELFGTPIQIKLENHPDAHFQFLYLGVFEPLPKGN